VPGLGHLEQAFHAFGCLKTHPKRKLAFDPGHPVVNENRFQKCDWTEFCRDASEAIAGNMPLPGGNGMSTHCFVDANHAGDTETRRSQTGVLLFCNKAPAIWFSRRQNSVEASTFGSEFTAMKNVVEMIETLRCKLRMFRVPIEGPTNVFCDNGAVCANATRLESSLTKKHHSIACHRLPSQQGSCSCWDCQGFQGACVCELGRHLHEDDAGTEERRPARQFCLLGTSWCMRFFCP
jgi:hypothetical protein